MKLAWLEELEKTGHVSADAKDEIYRDCNEILTKLGTGAEFQKAFNAGMAARGAVKKVNAVTVLRRIERLLTPQKKSLADRIGPAIIGGGLMGGYAFLDNMMKRHFDKGDFKKTLKDVAKTKMELMSDPEVIPDQEKAEARFQEVVTLFPSFASQTHLAVPFIKKRLHSGLTDKDSERLMALQAVYTPNTSMQTFLHEKTSAARLGDTMATIVAIMSEAEMDKTAAPKGRMGGMAAAGLALRNLLTIAAIPAMFGVGTGVVKELANMRDKKKLQEKLEGAFLQAMKDGDPETDPMYKDKNKARQAFDTLVHFSPHVASDPRAARAFMNRLVDYDTGIQTGDIKDLSEIERNLHSRSKPSPFFSGLAAGSDAAGFTKAIEGTISKATLPLQNEVADIFTE